MFAEITMNRLPEAIINKIMLYVSHPVADLFKDSEAYKEYNEECCWLSGEPQSFNDFYFLRYYINHCCDCCAKPWRDCQCWCVDCWIEYSKCRGECGNENVTNPSIALELHSDSE